MWYILHYTIHVEHYTANFHIWACRRKFLSFYWETHLTEKKSCRIENWKWIGGLGEDVDKLKLIFYGIYIKFPSCLFPLAAMKVSGGRKRLYGDIFPLLVWRKGRHTKSRVGTIKGKRKTSLFLCSQSPSFHQQFIKFSSQIVHLSRLPSGCGFSLEPFLFLISFLLLFGKFYNIAN